MCVRVYMDGLLEFALRPLRQPHVDADRTLLAPEIASGIELGFASLSTSAESRSMSDAHLEKDRRGRHGVTSACLDRNGGREAVWPADQVHCVSRVDDG